MLENENRNCNCNCNNGCMMNNNSNMIVENTDYPNTMTMSAGFSGNNASCNCCYEKNMMGSSIPMYCYEFTNIGEKETIPEKEATREEMIQRIRSLDFACVELAEYLDTHPEDEKALCLHREYATKLNELMEQYQKAFGPLTIAFPCNKWRWLEEPWPWERGSF